MRPAALVGLLLAALSLAVGCGKARSNPPASQDPNDVLDAGSCYPLGHAALAQSLAEPLAVGRDLFGTVYALSRVGSTSLLWRSLDDRLIAYPVVAESHAGASAASYGATDGSRGFALTTIPEVSPSVLRLFYDLADALPGTSSGLTTGGTTLEVLGPEALQPFTVSTELSPALLVGSYRTVPDAAPSASLLLVRTAPAADAPLAVFYGEGTQLEQRELLETDTIEPERLTVSFTLDGAVATAHLTRGIEPETGRLLIAGEERRLHRGVSTPLGLGQLELRCLASAPAAWQRPEPVPLPAASCSEPLPLFACAATTGPIVADVGPSLISIQAAQVVELGSGVSGAPSDHCSGRAVPLLDDARVNVRWARLESATGQHWLTVAGPELELPLSVGQQVALTALDDPTFSWVDWIGEVHVRSADDATLLLWMGQFDTFSQLYGTAHFDLTPGPERCVTLSECGGAISGYALGARPVSELEPAAPGGSWLVGYGERVRQGEYYIYNGGIEAISARPLCVYKPWGNARIAIWKPPGD